MLIINVCYTQGVLHSRCVTLVFYNDRDQQQVCLIWAHMNCSRTLILLTDQGRYVSALYMYVQWARDCKMIYLEEKFHEVLMDGSGVEIRRKCHMTLLCDKSNLRLAWFFSS